MLKITRNSISVAAICASFVMTFTATPSVAAPAQPCLVQVISSGSLTCTLDAGQTISFVMKAGNGGAGGNGGVGGSGSGAMGGIGGQGGTGGVGGSGAKSDFTYTNNSGSVQSLRFVVGTSGSTGVNGTNGAPGVGGTGGTSGGDGLSSVLSISSVTIYEVLPGLGGTGGTGGAPGGPEMNFGFPPTTTPGAPGLTGANGIAGSNGTGGTLTTTWLEASFISITAINSPQPTASATPIAAAPNNSGLATTGADSAPELFLFATGGLGLIGIGILLVRKKLSGTNA